MQTLNCKLIADVAVFSNDEVLLVKYKDQNKYDHQIGWFLPDDLVKEFEHPDDAAKRILKEQLNLSDIKIKLENIESFQGGDKSWHLVFHYKTELQAKTGVKPSEEIQTVEWFALNNLPDKKDVAHHGWALYTIDNVKC
ncbi:MAG: NUDIX hydrolase [bacterium]